MSYTGEAAPVHCCWPLFIVEYVASALDTSTGQVLGLWFKVLYSSATLVWLIAVVSFCNSE